MKNDTLVAQNNFVQEDEAAQPDQMFVVVRNVKNNGQGPEAQADRFSSEYKLNKGDIIKMGRLKFLVRDYRCDAVAANIDSGDSPVKQPRFSQ